MRLGVSRLGLRGGLRGRGLGFTLVEIMIALGIFSGIMVAIYASWAAILRGSRLGMDAAVEAQRLRVALRCIEDALSSVQMFQDNQPLYAFYADTSGDFASISLVSRLSRAFPGSGVFQGQNTRRLTFSVEAGTNTLPQLVMRQTPLLAAESGGNETYSLSLSQEVSLFTLEFWGANSKEWEQEWRFTNQLPKLVRMSIGFGSQGGYRGKPRDMVTRTIPIPAMLVPRAYQAPNAPGGGGGAVPTPTPVLPGGS